ncbi:MAG: ATP-binding protein [Geobacteraceae bacterium]|nr:ATP-binding protein [Geobacteraceae bacterium]
MFERLIAYTGLVNFITSFGLSVFLLLAKYRSAVCRAFVLFCLSVAYWSFHYFLWLREGDAGQALFLIRQAMLGAIFIPATYTYFVYQLLDKKDFRWVHYVNGILVLLFSLFSFSALYIPSVEPKLFFRHWPNPGMLLHFVLLYFVACVVYSHWLLWVAYRGSAGIKRQHILYVFLGTAIGFFGGATNYFLWYDIPIPAFLNILVCFFIITVTYAIAKYRLMDIQLILRKTIVFAGLFAVIMAAIGIVTVLAQSYLGQLFGIGPTSRQFLSIMIAFILFDPTRTFLTELTDRYLFQKKYDYHKLLKDASRGMSNIESLEHLLGLVVHFVTMKMRVRNAAVLMREGGSDQYHLVYQRGFDKNFLTLTLYQNDPLIHYLEAHKEAVDIERIKEQVESASYKRDRSDTAYDYEAIRERMNQLKASCCVPSFLGRELRNVLLLGEKKSGEYYSNEDLNLLYTLAQESSIAIENARLYDEAVKKSRELEHINDQLEHSKTLLMKALQEAEGANKQLQDTQAQLIHEQKMATLGRLAASVGHEVNNPLTILSMNVSRVILKYRKNQDMKVTEILDVFDKMEKNIERIKAVVNTLTGLLKKSEKGKFEPLSLKLILEETLPLVQFQTYLDNLSGTEVDFNVPGNVPLIRGDLERLQEVFLNLFINAYLAMAGKRHRKIGVLAEIDPRDPNMVAIHFRDNGSGMTEETAKKVFNYGFTTKPPGKGSGLGLYMCKYIIELHGGTITVDSRLGEGTTFTLTLPIYSETPVLKAAPPLAA